MSSTATIKYRYKLPTKRALFAVVIAILINVGLTYEAYSKGLPQLTNLSWQLAGLSWLLTLFVIWFVIRGQRIGDVELGEEAALIPKASLYMSLIRVPYHCIKRVKLVNLNKQLMAVISTSVGTARLNSTWFATLEDFQNFLQILEERRHAQARPNVATEALLYAIKEHSTEDPLIGAKIGAKEVYQRIFDALKDSKGVNIETLLCILGSLAGYSCQASVRAQALAKGIPENSLFITMGSETENYFFGDALNAPLAESKYSIWSLAAAAAQQAGCAEFLDVNEIFKHVTGSVCSERFGIIRVPENHQPSDKPVEYVKALWPSILPTVKLLCPEHDNWPILFGIAIQQAIDAGKSAIDPGMALKIVMESAIPMSKIDLKYGLEKT
ncbi:MAG: hypothetical protein KGZ69_08020 [Methylomonas sp.]|nr:hypothetical protein [Methylomonas sp.]